MEGAHMELKELRSFLAVVRAGSVTRAADELHITQPALSRQIAALERELGCALLERGRHGATPTDDGVLLVRRAEELLELAEKTETELRSSASHLEGTVAISCGQIAALDELAALAAAFRSKHPHVSVSLHITTSEGSHRRLSEGLADFAVLLEPFEPSGLTYVGLRTRERWVAVLRADDPLAGCDALGPAQLAAGPVILPYRAGARSVLASWFGRRYARLAVAGDANLSCAGETLVRAGLGRSLQVESGDPTASDVVHIPLDPAIDLGSALVWLEGKPMSRVAASFAEFVRAQLSSTDSPAL